MQKIWYGRNLKSFSEGSGGGGGGGGGGSGNGSGSGGGGGSNSSSNRRRSLTAVFYTYEASHLRTISVYVIGLFHHHLSRVRP